jgi:hypothetical protein
LLHLQRARGLPGPLLLIVFACAAGAPLHAHDPGLSSLEVSVDDRAISASLAIAAADVALFANGDDPSGKIDALARDAIRVSLDGRLLPIVIDAVAIADGAARVQMRFESGRSINGSVDLAIASDVPWRLLPGHRELMVVRIDGRTAAEQLLDAHSGPVTIELPRMLDGHHLILPVGLLLAGAMATRRSIALFRRSRAP